MRGMRRAFWSTARAAEPTASPEVLAACRDVSKYMTTVDNLMYLHSHQGLVQRGQHCLEITDALLERIRQNNDPVKSLDLVDTMNNTMCLILDPAEATRSTHPDDNYRHYASEAFNGVYRKMSELNTSRELYDILVELYRPEVWDTLTPIQRVNTTLMKTDMEANGIHLPRETRDRVVQLTSQKEELAHYLVTAPSEEEQQAITANLLETRHALAAILQHNSFAEWTMSQTMAETPENAWRFLGKLSRALQEKSKEEQELLGALRSSMAKQGDPTKYLPEQLSSIYRHRKYGAKVQKMREYLSVANVWRGLQLICKELFDVDIRKAEFTAPYEQYHPHVQKYHVCESDGTVIGTIYADLIDRKDKMVSAGHFTVQLGTTLHANVLQDLKMEGGKQLPIVIFSTNAQWRDDVSGDWEKVLLTSDEMVTMFHEFGHALHTVFGQTEYQNVAGTRSSLDYVETFSQLLEYFAKDHRVLAQFARHHETGETIPKDLCDALFEAEHCFAATTQLDQVVMSALDLASHGPRPMGYLDLDGAFVQTGGDYQVLMAGLQRAYQPLQPREGKHLPYSLNHLSNYPAGYYSYAYSKVLAASMWQQMFQDNPMDRENGRKLRRLMGMGASDTPRAMLKTAGFDQTEPSEMLDSISITSL
eukprot:TRINITY_DN30262_c0_g1_i1.p1 TRINITY_DN30262_c0_g1~~TRINITY_DN30262_c0_g1_i1.p1  ORF type:complete len:648 (+),score=288.17 TRINITY_DN30262_c0_g1_i1:68-2011(+)